ncbi:MAG: OmpA family protein [Zoogloea sp.]|nr:OmpA family protein [Zoogloea sp.]
MKKTNVRAVVALITSAALVLSGCATPGQGGVGAPVAGGQVGCGLQATTQTNNTLSGAAIGAGVGALVGAAAGRGHVKNVAAGAAVGGLVGAGVGAYMDQQQEVLKRDLSGSGINMARSGDVIILTLPEGILFASGKSALSAQARQGLDRLVNPLVKFDKTAVTVCGHTDNVGARDLNVKLSADRARAVSDYLAQKGVPASRLSAIGMADDQSIGDNKTQAGRATNRRVEVVLRPLQG